MVLNKLNIKLFSFILSFIFSIYLFEFYILNISDQYFVCVELIKNFNFSLTILPYQFTVMKDLTEMHL